MQQLVSMEGKCIVVTVAAQGIGKALSELVIEQGGSVVAVDLNPERLKETAASLPAERILPLVGSVTDEDFAAEAVRQGVTKFGAIHGLTMTAAREWGKYRIRANTVCFGVVETPMTETIRGEKFRDAMLAQIPMWHWTTPEEAVKTVAFLLSDSASYITGQHLAVNGGFHVSV